MALTTLAQGQNATITFPAPFDGKMVFNALEWSTNIQVHDVTGVRTGVADVESRFENSCFGDIRGTAIGVPFDGTTFGYGCNATLELKTTTSVSLSYNAYDYRFIKRFNLFDVTGSGDSDKKWSHGRSSYFMTSRGFINTTTDGLDDLTAAGLLQTVEGNGPSRAITAIVSLPEIGLINPQSNLKIIGVTKFVPFKKGGPIEVQFSAIYDKGIAYTTTGAEDFNLEDSTPTVGNLTIDMDDGVSVVHQIIVEKIDILADPRRGTPIRMILDWRYSA